MSKNPEIHPAQPPFHEGECAIQKRVGMREKLAKIGPLVIRDHMPDPHREFFAQLPWLIVGSVDASGQPWASVLASPPGFVQSPDPRHLQVRATPLPTDPLSDTRVNGAAIGLLGIEPQTRRRNRVNGIVEQVTRERFAVRVSQSFGNCPKYIQARTPVFVAGAGGPPRRGHRSAALDDAAREVIARADTFFIATAYGGSDAAPAHGVDVSHRGGRPGFVRVDNDGTLTVPDFVGNFFFNTLGNIEINPRAGLLFVDFESGDLLYLAVAAAIVWDGEERTAYAGAQRLLRFRVIEARFVEAALPLRWGAVETSPFLEATGAWTR